MWISGIALRVAPSQLPETSSVEALKCSIWARFLIMVHTKNFLCSTEYHSYFAIYNMRCAINFQNSSLSCEIKCQLLETSLCTLKCTIWSHFNTCTWKKCSTNLVVQFTLLWKSWKSAANCPYDQSKHSIAFCTHNTPPGHLPYTYHLQGVHSLLIITWLAWNNFRIDLAPYH